MVYLLLAILSSALVAIIMRISEKYVHNNVMLLVINYLMCLFLSGSYIGFAQVLTLPLGISPTLILGIVNGCFYLSGFLLLQKNIKENGVVLSSTFTKLGVIVPTLLSILIFHEYPTINQMIGISLALVAILILYLEKDTKFSFKLGLLILLIMNGSADAMSKIYQEIGKQAFPNHFLFYTFVFAFILCLILGLIKKQKINKEELGFGLLIGVPNYYSARFLLLSLKQIPAVIAYPTYSVATIIVVSIVGIFVFKEKLIIKQKIGILLILFALALLNS